MIRRIIIFALVYVASLMALILLNDDVAISEVNDRSLLTSSIINVNQKLLIETVFNENDSFDMDDEYLTQYTSSKIRVVSDAKLIDKLEVYTIDVHNNITDKAVITINGNKITIETDLMPLSLYKSSTFITFGQFDSDYFNRIPGRTYEIHIPEDMQYTFD